PLPSGLRLPPAPLPSSGPPTSVLRPGRGRQPGRGSLTRRGPFVPRAGNPAGTRAGPLVGNPAGTPTRTRSPPCNRPGSRHRVPPSASRPTASWASTASRPAGDTEPTADEESVRNVGPRDENSV